MTIAADGLTYPCADPPPPGGAVPVAPGILWLRMPLPPPLGHVNLYALDDRLGGGDGWTLVDAGPFPPGFADHWAPVLAGPLQGRPVRRVIVTHHHPDHVGGAGWFRAQGADLLMPRVAWLYARMLLLDAAERPPPELVAFWRGAGMPAAMLAERQAQRPFRYADSCAPLPLGFADLAEGARLTAGGRGWTVRLGGGHAPDHATLWSDDGQILLAGDQVLPGISSNIGVYATEPMADPLADWFAACDRLAVHATPDRLVLPGHRRPFRGLPQRLAALVADHKGALDRLRAALADGPLTAVGAFPALYRRAIGAGEFGLALAEAMAHLTHLHARGEVRRDDGPDGAWLWHRT